MSEQEILINRLTWARLAKGVKSFAASEVGRTARFRMGLLIALLLGVSALNVVNSYVGRDFMTSIADRNMAGFIRLALLYVVVFAASTLVAVFYRFTEERLGLLWREWLTKRLVAAYLGNHTYYRLKAGGDVQNPDERIADDVRAFTVTTLSFVLMILNGSITVIAFSGVMWSISRLLFAVTVLYAVLGSLLTIKLGKPLIGLNYRQLDKEANFRSALIHVMENAESIALTRREGRIQDRLTGRVKDLTGNLQRIISVNRNLGFFTTGYNWMIQIIPALFVVPLFMKGQVEFGVITQSAMAFAQLVGAFSLIINQFQSISSYAAVIARIDLLERSMEAAQSVRKTDIEIVEEGVEDSISYHGLTLYSPDGVRPLIKNLTVTLLQGTRVLISGPNGAAKVALFRATAGIWDNGSGRIVRPCLDCIRFLPERPYLFPGTLRELLSRSGEENVLPADRIIKSLQELGLRGVMERVGGLDVEQDWASVLSLSEEQLLAFTRLLLASPKFAFLDRVCTALSVEQVAAVLIMLSMHSITYIALEEDEDLLELYDAVLLIENDGSWKWKPILKGRIVEQPVQALR